MHYLKWVLHSLPVDAGAATPETHKTHPTGQKCSKANLHIKSMVHPDPTSIQNTKKCVHFPKPSPAHYCRYTMQSTYVASQGAHPVWRENLTHMFGSVNLSLPFICTRTFVRPQAEQGASPHKRKVCKMCMGVTGNLAIWTSPNHGG